MKIALNAESIKYRRAQILNDVKDISTTVCATFRDKSWAKTEWILAPTFIA